MHVAVIDRPHDPISLNLCQRNMVRELCAQGVVTETIPEAGPIPHGCDIVWDPSLCMRRFPQILADSSSPVIATVHGFKVFSLPLEEIISKNESSEYLLELKATLFEDWQWLRTKVRAIVAVSRYAAEEAQGAFSIDPSIVKVVHNGVDHDTFNPYGEYASGTYFLAVTSTNPLKNMDRVLEAYTRLPRLGRPDLVIIAPDLKRATSVKGVLFIDHELSHKEMARWYRGATALVFPSLRETFGLPIVEAMACGCPVITSYDTGCAEVAGNAALLINPRSVDAIASGMSRLAKDTLFRQLLVTKGAVRSHNFSWHTSAKQLVEIFKSVIRRH